MHEITESHISSVHGGNSYGIAEFFSAVVENSWEAFFAMSESAYDDCVEYDYHCHTDRVWSG